jgi:hypothetical protein
MTGTGQQRLPGDLEGTPLDMLEDSQLLGMVADGHIKSRDALDELALRRRVRQQTAARARVRLADIHPTTK